LLLLFGRHVVRALAHEPPILRFWRWLIDDLRSERREEAEQVSGVPSNGGLTRLAVRLQRAWRSLRWAARRQWLIERGIKVATPERMKQGRSALASSSRRTASTTGSSIATRKKRILQEGVARFGIGFTDGQAIMLGVASAFDYAIERNADIHIRELLAHYAGTQRQDQPQRFLRLCRRLQGAVEGAPSPTTTSSAS